MLWEPFIFGSEMQTTATTAHSINTQQLIYVNGSYQLVESLEGMLASKTKAMIDDCHFIKAFISSWLSAESLFTGLLFYGISAEIYYDDKKCCLPSDRHAPFKHISF